MLQHYNRTVIKELYKEWMKWSVWYWAVIITIRGVHWIAHYLSEEVPIIDHFIYFANESSSVLMLVIGVMMVFSFLRHYIEHGLTRKTYFIGGSIASLLIALTLGIIGIILSLLEGSILSLLNLTDLTSMESHSFSYWIGFFLLSTVTSWLYYMIGWFIGHVFYRYNWWKGIVACVIAFFFVMMESIINGESVSLYSFTIEGLSLSIFTSIIILILISAGMLVINYQLVKDIRVKMK
ncbi:hypothetical protein BME96_05380 [Virgibacillus halodenitrificans]|uniref:Uncharacterized protein n=1 Tax=Virgibacillus halodenitrificans TaxID=1482 RepID=A0AAC9IX02_VIRHA|nr:hypothetical protein [Virgibacillus halodenitrificans]APC47631.1 hypothetical protein BME96_05380 [Virgibacillus halodenitrificans]MCJ0930445.1 hypothetical protein [Virgibacillus halodenitrificans]